MRNMRKVKKYKYSSKSKYKVTARIPIPTKSSGGVPFFHYVFKSEVCCLAGGQSYRLKPTTQGLSESFEGFMKKWDEAPREPLQYKFTNLTVCVCLFINVCLWFLIPVAQAFTLQPQSPMNLTQYLKTYLSHDEDLKNSDLQTKISQSQLDKASDLYQNRLTLGSLQKHTGRNSSRISYERITQVSGGLTQNLPWGTSLNLNLDKFLEASHSSLLGMDADYSISIRQELLRNSFGRLDREVRTRAQSHLRLSQIQRQNQVLKSCYTGTQIFIYAYISQQKLSVFNEILNDSNQTLKFSENSYNRKILRKIDILSARADNLRIRSRQSLAQKEYQKNISSLTHPISVGKTSVQLKDPGSIFHGWKLETQMEPTRFLSYKEQEQMVLSTESALKIARQSADYQLDLGFTVGHREGAFQRMGTSLNEDYVQLSLTMDWPLFNKTDRAAVAQAQYERDMAVHNKQRTKKELSERQDHLNEDLRSSRERLQISRKKIKIYEQQIKEARRLLRTGKLEFEDYIRYRDTYLNERLHSMTLQNEMWSQKSHLAWLQSQVTLLCGETNP